MITELIELLKNISLRHKKVKTFKYQEKSFNNAQNNYDTLQVYVDDVSYHNLNITTNIFTVEFQVYILGHPDKSESGIISTQDECYTTAVDIIGYIDNKEEYRGIINIHDYSIITLSHYTDDDSAGVKLSLVLETPSPLNLCNIDDNFNDEPYEPTPESEIDIPETEVGEITLNPIKLPINPKC